MGKQFTHFLSPNIQIIAQGFWLQRLLEAVVSFSLRFTRSNPWLILCPRHEEFPKALSCPSWATPHRLGDESDQKSSACVGVDTRTWGEGLPMNYLPSNYQDFILVTLKASFMELQGGRICPISRQKDRRDMWAFPKQVVEYSPTYHVWLILLMKLKYSNVVK